MLKTGFAFFFSFLIYFSLSAQVVINEASNKNYRQLLDEDGEYNDWIELYNSGGTEIDLSGWALSDSKKNLLKWEFGDNTILPGGFLLIHASGKDRKETEVAKRWESAVLPTDTFSYIVPDASTVHYWKSIDFDDRSWNRGRAGFGYADNDDRTTLPQKTRSVYIRRKFFIPDTSVISGAVFHADYDDGFIAYLNGVKIAGANMGENPLWYSFATANHEAVMYNGGDPEVFNIDLQLLKSIIRQGDNVLCVQAHNNDEASTDLSIIPFLSFSLEGGGSYFQQLPAWFNTGTSKMLHTNFKLSAEGEEIYLSKEAVVIDSVNVPLMQLNQSIGRKTDGSNQFGIFTVATPGSSNNTSAANVNGYTIKPLLSHEAGFYSGAITVSISSFERNTTIRYTIDGSEPTETSAIYSSPIRISETKSLKARCFAAGKLPGDVVTATYFINEDYSIPILSVTTNRTNLYGDEGIFDHINESWNVPAYVEYFEKDKQLAFALAAGMQLDGGAGGSRSNAQHSFRIEPGNSTLGDGDLKYRLMPRRPNRNNFPSFYVRNGSNQHLVLPYKDGLQVAALGRNTFTYYSAYHPIVVYLNGEYFGVYELREKINDDYLVDNYQMDVDSIDFLGVSYFKYAVLNEPQLGALRGSVDPFIADFERFQQLNIQSENYLEEVDKFLDIKSYTDYIIAENWVANNDWPFNNIKLFRCKGTNYRWQWALNDLEWGLNPHGWTSSGFDHFNHMLNYGSGNYYTGFWYNLMQNPTYKAYFINRYADLMNTNYLFSEIGSLENEMFNEIYPEMEGEFSRWRSSANMTSQLRTFTSNHEIFSNELKQRSGVVRSQLQSHYGLTRQVLVTLDVEPRGAGCIQISTIVPLTYPWEGIYFTNVPVTVTALPNPGYKFSNWNSNAFITDQYVDTFTGKLTGSSVVLKAFFEPDENSDAGMVISEINYKSGTDLDSPDWLEFCNLGQEDINLNGWYFTDEDSNHVFTFDKDLFLSANQRIVISNNLNKFKSIYPSVIHYPGEFDFGLGTPSDQVNLYNNNDELIVSVHYSDNYPWPLSSDVAGRTLELRQPTSEENQPMSWFRGCIGGSPGSAYQYCDEHVAAPDLVAVNSFNVTAFPVPAGQFVNLNIQFAERPESYIVWVYGSMGNLLDKILLDDMDTGQNIYSLPLVEYPGNMLFIKVSNGNNEKLLKVLKLY